MYKLIHLIILSSFGFCGYLPATQQLPHFTICSFAKQERKGHTKPSKKDTYTVSSKPRKR